jgi:hypothetical protein
LQAAIDSGAPLEDAFPILERLNSMDAVLPAPQARSQSDRPAPVASQTAGASSRGRGLAWSVVTLIALAGIGAYAAIASSGDWRMLLGLQSVQSATLAPAARDVVLALPQRGEMALTRARTLAAGGALHDALSALDGVRATDPQKPDADRLRADLQRELLRLGAEHP